MDKRGGGSFVSDDPSALPFVSPFSRKMENRLSSYFLDQPLHEYGFSLRLAEGEGGRGRSVSQRNPPAAFLDEEPEEKPRAEKIKAPTPLPPLSVALPSAGKKVRRTRRPESSPRIPKPPDDGGMNAKTRARRWTRISEPGFRFGETRAALGLHGHEPPCS